MPNNFALAEYCNQRKKQLVFSVPPPRYTPISPYESGKYTQFQLDMRRKAEILKYSNNASSSKTNNMSKAERWAQIVNGNTNYQSSGYPSFTITTIDYNENYNTILIKYPMLFEKYPTSPYITTSTGTLVPNKAAYRIVGSSGYYSIVILPDGAAIGCPSDGLIPTPTSSSNVPGPITYLINDETIPLYNYNSNVNSYSKDSNNNTMKKWSYTTTSDLFLINGSNNIFLTMMIGKEIDQSTYTFSVTMPISIYVRGTNLNLDSATWSFPGLSVGITDINFEVNYNNTPISFKTPPSVTFNGATTQKFTYNNGSYYNNNLLNLLNFNVLFGTPPIYTVDSYTAKLYIGTITISNILLNTEPGYVYDFILQINTTNLQHRPINYDVAVGTTSIGTYANVPSSATIGNNCTITPTIAPPFQPLSLTGF
jgi:hypothetical protein